MLQNMKIGSRKWQALIKEGAGKLGIKIKRDRVEKLSQYAVELYKWNQKVNLTAITDSLEVAVKHFVDSLVPAVALETGSSLVDIGTGGGFPGIPIKTLRPSIKVILVDSSRKKVNFLKHVIRITSLTQIDAIHARAEDLAKDDAFAGYFDIAVCRAFSSVDHFVSLALPLLKKRKGTMIAMKGIKKEDFQFLHTCGEYDFEIQKSTYTLPFINSERTLIKIRTF